ncbi:MAG: hypothetical protein ABWU84_12820 [Pyrobaculum sp.]|uniref:hypothetical protein n=1 Tax=Pyrobaculum sp. TaxID=2004705 RepID=UPI003EEE7109
MMEYFKRFWGVASIPPFRVYIRRLPPDILGEYHPPGKVVLAKWDSAVYFHELSHHIIYHSGREYPTIVEELVSDIAAAVATRRIATRPGVGWGLLELGQLHKPCKAKAGGRRVKYYGHYLRPSCILLQYLRYPQLLVSFF